MLLLLLVHILFGGAKDSAAPPASYAQNRLLRMPLVGKNLPLCLPVAARPRTLPRALS